MCNSKYSFLSAPNAKKVTESMCQRARVTGGTICHCVRALGARWSRVCATRARTSYIGAGRGMRARRVAHGCEPAPCLGRTDAPAPYLGRTDAAMCCSAGDSGPLAHERSAFFLHLARRGSCICYCARKMCYTSQKLGSPYSQLSDTQEKGDKPSTCFFRTVRASLIKKQ